MIHKRLKVLILSAAFLGLPGVQAFKWSPAGDFVGSDGFAYDKGSVYNEGDRIVNTSATPQEGGETMRHPRATKMRAMKSRMFKGGKRLKSMLKYRFRGDETTVGATGDETTTPPVVVTPGNNT
ncbi:hypothetical protein FJ364_06115, partial [Candidatus Dependentiae bacterium]|nr:hypothetical protein [Candidatus Dependentiae bacterium]